MPDPARPTPAAALQVRPFEPQDLAALRRLFLQARTATFTWLDATTFQLHDFDLHTLGERVLVALLDGEPVGFASIWEPDSFLHNLFIAPAAQRRGVGAALLAACAAYFTQPPTLKCLKANANALAFYERMGWRVIGEGDAADGPYVLMRGERG